MKLCGCKDMNHAITKAQRAYCKRALSIAYQMRDFSAVSKIKGALAPCPSIDPGLANAHVSGWGDIAERIVSTMTDEQFKTIDSTAIVG